MHRKNTNTVTVVCTILGHLAYGVTPSTYFCRPCQVLHLLPTECKTCFHNFFKWALDGKNLCKVEYISVEYYASWRVTVQYCTLRYLPSGELHLCVTYCPWLKGTGFIVHNFAQPLIQNFTNYKIPPLDETYELQVQKYENVLKLSDAMI